jgi:hypothetical protein
LSGHIFISYARQEDGPYAHALAGELDRRGFKVWIDARIDPGVAWWHGVGDLFHLIGSLDRLGRGLVGDRAAANHCPLSISLFQRPAPVAA